MPAADVGGPSQTGGQPGTVLLLSPNPHRIQIDVEGAPSVLTSVWIHCKLGLSSNTVPKLELILSSKLIFHTDSERPVDTGASCQCGI